MASPVEGKPLFQDAARRVVARWVLARGCGLLGRSAAPVFLGAAGLVVTLRVLRVRGWDPAVPVALVVCWLVAMAAWAWLRRPSPCQALALWDERAGREEMFVSAFCFERLAAPDAGERLHLARARERLAEELGALRRHLAARLPRRAWMAPLPFLVLVLSGLFRPALRSSDDALTDEARERARREAEALAETKKVLDPLKSLTPDERKAAEELKSALHETAGKLRELGQETPRDVLEELERRARAAEQLAESLGAGGEDLLSPQMVAELERHADTADFAGQVRAKALQKIADEAEKLADRLRADGLPLDEQKRIEDALDKGLQAGTPADKPRVIGQHLAAAHRELKGDRPRPAAEEFSQIARHFTQAAERQQGQKQLQQLAQNLRAAGQHIFGGKQAGMQRLDQPGEAGLRPIGAQPMPNAGALPLAQWAMGQRPAQAPMGTGTPSLVPGQSPGQGMSQTPVPGTQGQGMGTSPVPGQGQGMGQGTGPGMAQGLLAGARAGGLYAGRGTAPYGNTPTDPLKATSTQAVAPKLGQEGPSEFRHVDPSVHREEAQRQARQLALRFLRAQEEALNEEPLPLARREQVLRYFTTLRRRIEDER